ncbi:MAG: PBP1A family penicillin-binding protein [Candidatus Levybacteria bacterium]|nr:PBP1A family penicillin-binding protein [Candidatus Levybacteria bacterium]
MWNSVKEQFLKLWGIAIAIREDPKMIRKILNELWLTAKPILPYIVIGGFLLLVFIPTATYLYFVRDLSTKESIIAHKSEGILLLDRNGKPFFSFYQAREKTTIPISQIPKLTQEAVISVEDKEFYNHPGFSLRGIVRALLTDIKEEQLRQGGSTLTQQVVKNTLLTQEKSFLRKYQEIFLALELERRYSKEDILEIYLNTAYFGEGAFGTEDAAKTYFGKTAADLTLGESALLAGILPAPSAYSPLTGDHEKAFARQRLVLKQMRSLGFITDAERVAALKQQIAFNPAPKTLNVKAPHFALMVKDELIKKYGEQGVAGSGFTVRTTIDLPLQEYAEQVVENQVTRLAKNKVTNAAAVVLDPKTGEILTLVGSHNWTDETNGKINMALRARQPGSSFKPIVYAKAIDEHFITAATQLDDKPISFPDGYKPKNYDGKFRGKVLVRFALANSLNIPAVLVMERVGVPDAIEMAEQLGITTLKSPQDYGLSMVLGAAEIPLLELTTAYGVFANHGMKVTPTTIIEIKDKNGKVVYTHAPDPRQTLDEQVTFIISSILSDNSARQEVFGNALTISRPAAVKTGTTEDYRDALTVGYTPSLAVGVWVGNNDRMPMDSIAGSLGAAPIWRLLMEKALRGMPIERFITPSGIIRTPVCKENGYRANTATSSAYPEYFLKGTVPIKDCNAPLEFPSPTEEPTPTPFEEEEPTETPTPEPTNPPTGGPTETPTPTLEPPITFP